MSAKRDYYEVLGVSESADATEIKSQYRKLALKFHPDRNKSGDAQEHFKEITEAYGVLSDPQKRQIYDQRGHAGIDGQYTQEDIFQGARGGFGDIFQNVFGGGFDFFGGGGDRTARGEDIFRELEITLDDVLHGKTVRMTLNKEVSCNSCSGSGCAPGTSKKRCSSCNGQGQVRKSRQTGFASFVTVETCRDCRGAGSVNQKPCRDCRGSGRRQGSKEVQFDLPKGLESGDYRISGAGNEVPGGISGDLMVRVNIKSHLDFRRDGANIYFDRHISMVDAALGGKFPVPTLEGSSSVKVDAGTQPNTIIKMGGKGLPKMNKWGRGDQFVRIVVDIPTKLTRKQKTLLQEFVESN